MELSHYEEVPRLVQDKLIAEYQKPHVAARPNEDDPVPAWVGRRRKSPSPGGRTFQPEQESRASRRDGGSGLPAGFQRQTSLRISRQTHL